MAKPIAWQNPEGYPWQNPWDYTRLNHMAKPIEWQKPLGYPWQKPWNQKGWGQNAKLGPHSAIWGKLGTALQAYALNPCTKFPPNPTSRKVNT